MNQIETVAQRMLAITAEFKGLVKVPLEALHAAAFQDIDPAAFEAIVRSDALVHRLRAHEVDLWVRGGAVRLIENIRPPLEEFISPWIGQAALSTVALGPVAGSCAHCGMTDEPTELTQYADGLRMHARCRATFGAWSATARRYRRQVHEFELAHAARVAAGDYRLGDNYLH